MKNLNYPILFLIGFTLWFFGLNYINYTLLNMGYSFWSVFGISYGISVVSTLIYHKINEYQTKKMNIKRLYDDFRASKTLEELKDDAPNL